MLRIVFTILRKIIIVIKVTNMGYNLTFNIAEKRNNQWNVSSKFGNILLVYPLNKYGNTPTYGITTNYRQTLKIQFTEFYYARSLVTNLCSHFVLNGMIWSFLFVRLLVFYALTDFDNWLFRFDLFVRHLPMSRDYRWTVSIQY